MPAAGLAAVSQAETRVQPEPATGEDGVRRLGVPKQTPYSFSADRVSLSRTTRVFFPQRASRVSAALETAKRGPGRPRRYRARGELQPGLCPPRLEGRGRSLLPFLSREIDCEFPTSSPAPAPSRKYALDAPAPPPWVSDNFERVAQQDGRCTSVTLNRLCKSRTYRSKGARNMPQRTNFLIAPVINQRAHGAFINADKPSLTFFPSPLTFTREKQNFYYWID